MIMPEADGAVATEMLVGGAVKRRDTWESRESAYAVLKGRGTWKTWDDRVLQSYVEHGMREISTGVTLKCSRMQEAACYRDPIGSRRVYHNFQNIIKRVPTHLVYGAINDYIQANVKEDVVNNSAGGLHNLASFSRVPRAGHLVPQMNPTGLAEKIYDALVKRAKL